MAKQLLHEICASTILMCASIVVIFASLANAYPSRHLAKRGEPWANPCTPNGKFTMMEQEIKDDTVQYLLEKTEESYHHSGYIEHIIVSKLGDPEVVYYLRQKNLEGFPKPTREETEQKVNSTETLIEHYGKLSRVAVFLERIYHEEIDLELKEELEDLFFSHLSQMCEIQLIFSEMKKSPVYPVADRSFFREKTQQRRTRFRRYEIDMITIWRYRQLLTFLMSQYKTLYF